LTISGQNIYYAYTYGARPTIEESIEFAVQSWFNERWHTPLDVIGHLYQPAGPVVGHFTQMIHDLNTRVGCSMVDWTDENGERMWYKITCNYFKSHFIGQPVYVAGELCSNCNSCDEDDFAGLCLA